MVTCSGYDLTSNEFAGSSRVKIDMAGQQYYYKIVLLGDVGVGKTSLFNRIKTGRFVQVPATTVGQGADQYTYSTTIGDDSLNVSYTYCMWFNFRMTPHKTNAVVRTSGCG